MKNKILLVVSTIPLLFLVSCGAESYLAEGAWGFICATVDSYCGNYGDQKTIDAWNSIKSDYSYSSYSTDAGQKLAQGDWLGAAISASSAGASAAGVDESIIALANAGANNLRNGNSNAAMIDATHLVGKAIGIKGIDRVCETQRNISRINQEYRENIKNGMSQDEAIRIRNEKLGPEITKLYFDAKEAHDEAQREKAMRKREMLRDGIMQRGYNEMEARYYSSLIDLSDVNIYDSSSVNSALNMAHIAYKAPSDAGAFFNDGYEIPAPVVEKEAPAVEKKAPVAEENPVTPVVHPKPIDPSADAKARLKKIAPDRYLLNHVGLNKTQKETLDEVASLMNQYPNIRICLNGNTCDLGTDYINELIATKRANHAKDYLVKQGVDASRIEIESKAASNPVMEGQTGESRLQNRRVSITILGD